MRGGTTAKPATPHRSPSLLTAAHSLAEQAVVLADIGRPADGATMSEHARPRSLGQCAPAGVDRGSAWRGAGSRRRDTDSLRVFDHAAEVPPPDCAPDAAGPYVALDEAHLARWRRHALARLGDSNAVPVLVEAVRVHNAEFTRVEAALRVDLICAYLAAGDTDVATTLLPDTIMIADRFGSRRRHERLAGLPHLLETG